MYLLYVPLPLHVAPNATVVRSETACGPASPIAHLGADAQFSNGTSRGWRYVDGPQGFFVTPGARSIYILDTYNNKVKVAHRSANGSSFGGWQTLAGSGAAGSDDGAAALRQVMIGDPDYYDRWRFVADHTGGWHCPGPFKKHRLLARTGNPAILPPEGMLGPWDG